MEQSKKCMRVYLALHLAWSCYGDQKAIICMLLKRRSPPLQHSFTPSRKCHTDTGNAVESTFSRKKHDVTLTGLSLSEPARQPIHQQTDRTKQPIFPLNKSPLDRPRSTAIPPPGFMQFWNTSCCELADLLASTNSLRTE